MNLAGGKRLVRDSKGEEFEVYEHELSDILWVENFWSILDSDSTR